MSKKLIDIYPPEKLKEYYQGSLKEGIVKEKKITVVGKKKGASFRKSILFTSLFFVFVLIFLHFFLAQSEIKIWPETEILNFKEKVNIDLKINQLDLAGKIIPGEMVKEEKEISQEFSATGKIKKKAQGKIRVYNKYHQLVSLRAGTRFQPPVEEILYFCSPDKMVIPAKSYIDVKVEACYPGEGEKYNIRPSKFSLPGLAGTELFYFIHGESFDSMTGGGEAPKVSEEDLNRAKNTLVEKLFKEGKDSLKEKAIKEDFILLDEAISQEIIETLPLVKAGTEVEKFNFQMKVKSVGIGFKNSNIENFAKEFVSLNLPADKKIQEKSLKIDYIPESINVDSGKITLSLEISAKAFADIDQTALKKALLGKSLKETQVLLENQPKISRVQIKVFPFWLKKNPQKEENIKIKLNLD